MFKKTVSINGKYKSLVISDGNLINTEDGEVIDLIAVLSQIYGDEPFALSTSSKADEELA